MHMQIEQVAAQAPTERRQDSPAAPPLASLLPLLASRTSSRPAVATSTRAATMTTGERCRRGLPGGRPFDTACSSGPVCPGLMGAAITRCSDQEVCRRAAGATRKQRSRRRHFKRSE